MRTKIALHIRTSWFCELLRNCNRDFSLLFKDIVSRTFHFLKGFVHSLHRILAALWMEGFMRIIILELDFTQHPVTRQSSLSQRLDTDYIDKNNGPGSERNH